MAITVNAGGHVEHDGQEHYFRSLVQIPRSALKLNQTTAGTLDSPEGAITLTANKDHLHGYVESPSSTTRGHQLGIFLNATESLSIEAMAVICAPRKNSTFFGFKAGKH